MSIIIILSCLAAFSRGSIEFGPRQRFRDTTALDQTVAPDIFSPLSAVPGNCNVSTQSAPLGSAWHSLSIVDEPRVQRNTTVHNYLAPYHLYADRSRPSIMFSDGSTEYVPQRESHSTVWYMYPRIGAPKNFDMEPATDVSDEPGWFTSFRPYYVPNRVPMNLVYTSDGLECIETPNAYASNGFYSSLEGVHAAFPAPHLSPHLPQADIVICDKLDRFIVITTSFDLLSFTYNRVHSIIEDPDRFPMKNGDWGINSPNEVITSLPLGHSPQSCLTGDLSAGLSDPLDDPLRSHHVVLVGTDNGQQIEDWVPHHNTWTPIYDFDYDVELFAAGDKTDISHFTRGGSDPIVRVEGGDMRRAVVVDLDGDGDQDLLVVAGPSPAILSSHVMVVEARSDPYNNARYKYVTTDHLKSSYMKDIAFVVTTDVNGDGYLDVVALGSSLVWFPGENTTNVQFHDPIVISRKCDNEIVAAYGLVAADIDGDGDDDLIVTRGKENVTLVYENVFHETGAHSCTLEEAFAPAIALPIGDAIPLGRDRALALGDIDGDGDKDVVVTSDGPDINSWGLYYYENTARHTCLIHGYPTVRSSTFESISEIYTWQRCQARCLDDALFPWCKSWVWRDSTHTISTLRNTCVLYGAGADYTTVADDGAQRSCAQRHCASCPAIDTISPSTTQGIDEVPIGCLEPPEGSNFLAEGFSVGSHFEISFTWNATGRLIMSERYHMIFNLENVDGTTPLPMVLVDTFIDSSRFFMSTRARNENYGRFTDFYDGIIDIVLRVEGNYVEFFIEGESIYSSLDSEPYWPAENARFIGDGVESATDFCDLKLRNFPTGAH